MHERPAPWPIRYPLLHGGRDCRMTVRANGASGKPVAVERQSDGSSHARPCVRDELAGTFLEQPQHPIVRASAWPREQDRQPAQRPLPPRLAHTGRRSPSVGRARGTGL